RRLQEAHGKPQQRGLAAAVRADQNGGRAVRERERNVIEDRQVADDDRDLVEHDRKIGERRAHGHPANCYPAKRYPAKRSPARRMPHASAFTMTTIAIRMRPSPIASGRSPFEVSSAIAVVMVRVKPSILPPTMITAPTSAAARPNPARSAVTRLKRASQINVATRP